MNNFRLANPCQNKESRRKKHDKRDKRNANDVFSTHPLFWNVADPAKHLKSRGRDVRLRPHVAD